MPPLGLRARKRAMGEFSPKGSMSSILVLGSSTKTVVTPWAGKGTGPETFAPKRSR